jgi:hypothetical protein
VELQGVIQWQRRDQCRLSTCPTHTRRLALDYGHHVDPGRAGYRHLLSAPHSSVVWRRTLHVQKLARFTPTMQPMFCPRAFLGEWAALQLYTAHTAHASVLPPLIPSPSHQTHLSFLNYFNTAVVLPCGLRTARESPLQWAECPQRHAERDPPSVVCAPAVTADNAARV